MPGLTKRKAANKVMTIRAVVQGVGHYLPEKVVPNSEFEKSLDTSDDWIVARSGIERRHFAAERAKAQGTAQTGQNSVQNLPSDVIARQVNQVAADLGLSDTAGGEHARRRATLRRAAE